MTVADGAGPGCEALGEGWLTEPVSAVSSLAFVVAGGLVVALARRHRSAAAGGAPGAGTPGSAPAAVEVPRRDVLGYAALVAAVGLGSVVQHGPDPWWSGVAHDVPLMATLAFVAADGVADLTRRPRRAWWWLTPTIVVVPAALTSATVSTAAQSVVAAGAIGATLLRAWLRPGLRRPVLAAVALLGVGALVGTLSRAGGVLCDPDRLFQGHAVWHVLASTALVVLAPVVGRRTAVDAGLRA